MERVPVRMDNERIMAPSLDASLKAGVIDDGGDVGNGLSSFSSEVTMVVAGDGYTVEVPKLVKETSVVRVVVEACGMDCWELGVEVVEVGIAMEELSGLNTLVELH